MRRIDLVAATMQGWSRLSPLQREKFFEAFVSAALRLDRVAMRDWLSITVAVFCFEVGSLSCGLVSSTPE